MRRAALVIVFLLALYIGPVILAPSYMVPARQNGQNMVKDFSSSTYGTPILADAGSANGTTGYDTNLDYRYTRTLDSASYSCYDSVGPSITAVYLNFTIPDSNNVTNLMIGAYADISTGTGNISIWNFSSGSWVYCKNIPIPYEAYSWCNVTVYDSDYWVSGVAWLRFETSHTTECNIAVDYAEVKAYYMMWNTVGIAELWFDTPEWNIIATAILTFVIELFTGSLDAFIILLGLIMIPASTLYLVKGGRDEMSSDKFFYFIIVFIIGWALLIGGIMP